MKPTSVFLVCFSGAWICGALAIFFVGGDIFGSIYRVSSHHHDHSHIFWFLQSTVFGLVSMAWWQTFSRAGILIRSISAVVAVWISVLFAAVPSSLLWMQFEYGLIELSSKQVFNLLPHGFEAAIVLYLTSIPLNIFMTVAAGTLLVCLPKSTAVESSLAYFRAAKSKSPVWNLLKTFAQTVIFWFSFLYLIPQILLAFERFFGIRPFQFSGQAPLAAIGFLLASIGGLWSGATMAVEGRGTPLPFDTASNLVVSGPYKYVRNPMALFGLAQGLFVGIFLGSYFIFPYVFLGAWLWNTYVRPVEEAELRLRFGSSYDDYCREVACWRFGFRK